MPQMSATRVVLLLISRTRKVLNCLRQPLRKQVTPERWSLEWMLQRLNFTERTKSYDLNFKEEIHLTKMTGRPMLSSLLRLGSKYRLSVMTFLSPTLRGLARQLPRRLAMLFFFKMKKVKQQNNTCWHTHLNGELVQGMTH
ncbi:uncharacterized protein LOC107031429 isoform X3 [Solanum pennellii]|uniref:Uncharacterized protein LOC107031429 isoform X3 n=1 Tax=Solanum pennellii TaxID=28526 RepID=A0ABM1VI71_SOLPN|nr:uncharacterized protein LOC107031429 isoform X3 [Solanum pennellii]XP_027775440.1 uncharacterized protein LOC107031429 isoform X3 [Solanum pennellii]XP_027775441.1 uncharacterized protein LOC107031429 isoform X3 [Solanum pennellii]